MEPTASGHVVSGAHRLYWEATGNPAGVAVLHLHGGPGGPLGRGYRRRVDPERAFIVGLEQRGTGRSTPTGITVDGPSWAEHIGDLEVLRQHLGVERWIVTGMSWGTTLGLAYAQAHPERVLGLALAAVTLTGAAEIRWLTEDIGRVFPEAWARFDAGAARRDGERVLEAYHRQLFGPDPAPAALAWCAWEQAHVGLSGFPPDPRMADPAFAVPFARQVVHCWKRVVDGLEPDLMAHVDRLEGLPGVLVHGRRDVSLPVDTPWRLHRAWPGSELVVVEEEGHGGPVMIEHLTRALDRWVRAAG